VSDAGSYSLFNRAQTSRPAADENHDEMNNPIRLVVAVLAASVASAACGAYMAPRIVPPARSPAFEPFRAALQTYIDETLPFRREAAAQGDAVPDQTSTNRSDEAVRLRQQSLAEAIQTKVRPAAQQGDLLSPTVADVIRRQLARVLGGPKGDHVRDALDDQNEGIDAAAIAISVNQRVAVARVPPVLMETLPQLPPQVEFAFNGRTLILRDTDADVVVDFIPEAFPDWSKDHDTSERDRRGVGPRLVDR